MKPTPRQPLLHPRQEPGAGHSGPESRDAHKERPAEEGRPVCGWQPAAQRFSLRRASEADIESIRRLAGEVFPATYREILSPAQLDYMMAWMYAPETLAHELRQPAFAWFLVACEGEPCGYLSIEQEAEALFHLQKIYLLPRFQGLGAGAWLFGQAVAYIREQGSGSCRMELNVNRHNRAVGFYERMGMRKLREGDFPIGGGYYMNDYIMGLTIERER